MPIVGSRYINTKIPGHKLANIPNNNCYGYYASNKTSNVCYMNTSVFLKYFVEFESKSPCIYLSASGQWSNGRVTLRKILSAEVILKLMQ